MHNMQMETPHAPNPEDELRVLEPISPLLYEGFERATELACGYFEDQRRPVDPSLFPEIARYEMKHFLEGHGQVVEELSREEVGHNGLCITFAERRIRMWKAPDDQLPVASASQKRRDFLNQQLELYLNEGVLKAVEWNLVILWNVDSTYGLDGLHLVCPKSASRDGLKVESHWAVRIPHPAASAPPAFYKKEKESAGDLPLKIASEEERDVS